MQESSFYRYDTRKYEMKFCCENIKYRIRVGGGTLTKNLSIWFDGMTVKDAGDEECILEGKIKDQAALYSLLIKIRDLGLKLISVERF
jgi:hypothetical protein